MNDSATPGPRELNGTGLQLLDFLGYSPAHKYIYRPTGELWPASTVNARLPWPTGLDGRPRKPSELLDSLCSVECMTWHPGEPHHMLCDACYHGAKARALHRSGAKASQRGGP